MAEFVDCWNEPGIWGAMDAHLQAMLSVRASCLAQMGEFEEAVKWVQQATHQSNAHFHILAIAVYITCAAGETDLAGKYKERLLQARPDYRIGDFFAASLCDPRRTRTLSPTVSNMPVCPSRSVPNLGCSFLV